MSRPGNGLGEPDWSRLFHAYGVAVDVPAHLDALAGDDERARVKAVDHLWAAVIHQGTPWSATPPAALVVAGLLSDPRTARRRVASAPLRAVLLDFLGEVGEAAQPEVPQEEIRAAADPRGREAEIAATLETLLSEDSEDSEESEDVWDEEAIEVIMAQVVLDLRAAVPYLTEAVAACLAEEEPAVRDAASKALAVLRRVPTDGSSDT
ncbi:hypothetical protein ABT340_13925 [Streptosporangium sp. NPDC000239]|uniref:hypothetical protein n=1 Tax=Streptosporangium sp. NPDC000239 TaxID=3154248 RepID=UPI0033345801